MRRFVVTAAFFALAVGMLFGLPVGAEEETGEKRPESAETGEVRPEENGGQEKVRKNEGPGWPRPYKPTEEISADSTVPFPTDI